VISIGEPTAGNVLSFRVQAQEVWDVVRIDARPSESIRTAKMYALNTLIPDALFPDEFSVKLNGCEIFDESISLSRAGVLDGSTLLVARRRRRPVRS
jgi:hypothetical protein